MRRTVTTLLHIGLASALILLAACDDSTGDTADAEGNAPSPTATEDGAATPTSSPTATTTTGATASPTTGPAQGGASMDVTWDDSILEVRDGTWPVGDAGEVEFAVSGDRLELVEVRPADGWSVTEQEIEDDEIEVDFRRGDVDWTVKVEIDNGVLEIEIDQDVHGAEPGVYAVGLAGTVAFQVSDGALSLGEIVTNEDWSHRIEEQEAGAIEVDFRRDNVTWEFKVERDDGRLEVEIDFKIEGRYPTS
ncbi:MAG: hypothetical protein M0R73_04955 [Dehalococcoidia bacterium]|nr:hypothetical protein [Dehalococcoidia bacterium]